MNKLITETLADKEEFLPVLNHFITCSIQAQLEESEDRGPLSYYAFYEQFLPQVAHRSYEYIYSYGQSPIEKIFLASLLLLAVKSQMACLHITPPMKNAPQQIAEFRTHHLLIMELIESYKVATGDEELIEFETALAEQVKTGRLSEEDRLNIGVHRSIIQHFEWNAYHLTLQAGLPDIKINGKAIRVDLLIWVPGDESVKIVVECDGFAYHSSKQSFEADRVRDRMLQRNGYRVIRFSGAEINKDPVKVSHEVFDLLQALDQDEKGNRIF